MQGRRLIVPAGKASPSPPVGPALGARGVKSMDFCKEFNARTAHLQPGIPTPVIITIQPDRTFTFLIKSPTVSYLLKQAAGIDKGIGKVPVGRVVSEQDALATLSVKHIYEIAKIKAKDEHLKGVPIEGIAKSIVGTAKTLGGFPFNFAVLWPYTLG
jgi:large subunit ribosomal protein L11